MKSRLIVFSLVAFLQHFANTEVTFAQGAIYVPERVSWGYYDPYYAITDRIYAQATLIQAQGEAAVSYATARGLNANAYSTELDNWKKQVRAYWDTKIIAERKRLELEHVQQISRMKYINNRKWENSRTWERLKNHPELSDSQIRSGKALNFLLDRLAASALPYEFNSGSSRFGPEALREVSLTDEWLANITLEQGAIQFPANLSVAEEINHWPYLLRWDEFDDERTTFEAARRKVLEESRADGQASVDSIRELQESLLLLANAFHRSRKVKTWVHENIRYSQFNAVDRFLHDRDREIARLEETGDIRPFQDRDGYDPDVDGANVISLLTYMNRNGISFAPASPGQEWAYYDLFSTMRAIYLTVDESDESIQPVDLSKIEQAQPCRSLIRPSLQPANGRHLFQNTSAWRDTGRL